MTTVQADDSEHPGIMLSPSMLSMTLFHKFYECTSTGGAIVLNMQHRMHRALCEFPSTEFYDGQLLTDPSVNGRKIPFFPWPESERPLCFLNVPGGSQYRVNSSYGNKAEAEAVTEVVKSFKRNNEDLTSNQICVLTPYTGQRQVIRQTLNTHQLTGVEVSTIDGFQGRESSIVIISTVRANPDGNLGFTDDAARVNVALTRARDGLVVVGNEETLRTSDLWSRWLAQAPRIYREHLSREMVAPNRNGGAEPHPAAQISHTGRNNNRSQPRYDRSRNESRKGHQNWNGNGESRQDQRHSRGRGSYSGRAQRGRTMRSTDHLARKQECTSSSEGDAICGSNVQNQERVHDSMGQRQTWPSDNNTRDLGHVSNVESQRRGPGSMKQSVSGAGSRRGGRRGSRNNHNIET